MPKKNIKDVVSHDLCVGCGICVDTCAFKAISVNERHGRNMPSVDSGKCINCGECRLSCPGIGVNLAAMSSRLYNRETNTKVFHDDMLGYYTSLNMGWCNNPDIRLHGASGGIVTGLLVYMLEKHIIDGAVVTSFREDNPLRPQTYIARTREDIFKGRSSKYCAVSMAGIISDLKKAEGKYAIVGLPCHIQAIRKYAERHKRFSSKIFTYIAIYCSINKTYLSLDYTLRRYNMKHNDIKFFCYRDDGCMGYMKIEDKYNYVIKESFENYFIPMHGFFNISRCNLCVDHTGELADVCVGDVKEDDDYTQTIGESSFIVRNNKMQKIINEAVAAGWLYVEPLPIEVLKRRQLYMRKFKKGNGVRQAFAFRKLTWRKTPVYDIDIKPVYSVGGVIKELKKVFIRYVGAHKYMWWLLDAINRTYRPTKFNV